MFKTEIGDAKVRISFKIRYSYILLESLKEQKYE